jgi:tRNA pseudouridine55 synthase
VLVALRAATLGDEDVAVAACPPIAAALAAERARAEQVPPAFSAIRVGGTRSHALARRGEVPELPARPVAVRRLDVIGGGLEPEPHLSIALDVSKGYFVRSLARDLAAALGTVGHLTALRRTRSGPFSLEGAVALDASTADPGALERAIVPLAEAARRALPSSVLSEAGVAAAARGQRVLVSDVRDAHVAPSAWLDESGRLVAIGQIDAEQGAGRVLRGFHDGG